MLWVCLGRFPEICVLLREGEWLLILVIVYREGWYECFGQGSCDGFYSSGAD